jgi:hypothetical protein
LIATPGDRHPIVDDVGLQFDTIMFLAPDGSEIEIADSAARFLSRQAAWLPRAR